MTNFDFFGMFDYLTGDDDTYKYSSTEFSTFISGLTGNGVSANYGGEFDITANGLELTVASGSCFIDGRFGVNEDSKTYTLPATQTGETKRYLLVAECDIGSRVMGLNLVAGTGAAFPTPVNTDIVKQIPLYEITVSNGSNVVINDVRKYTYNATTLKDNLNRIDSDIANRAVLGHTHTLNDITDFQVIYSSTQPTPVNGAIWLKPLV